MSRSGLEPFKALWVFLLVVLLGMGIHVVGYYPLATWVCAGMAPKRLFQGAQMRSLRG